MIQDQVAIAGRALPWADTALFAELMLCWELRSYRIAAAQTAPVLFDRGVPDIVGYLKLEGLPVPDHVHTAAQRFRYHHRVFIAPPGRRSTSRTASAGSPTRRPSAPTSQWSPRTPPTVTNWYTFPSPPSRSGHDSSPTPFADHFGSTRLVAGGFY
ncbi:AAA family ATPase [Streptomyces sp. HG99]|uniref:AAA family ATPase n=1 Tax=Streptomyces sp. HG99 TaxID=1958787 RepID=UPI001F0BA773|nr:MULTISPECIES: AAA family ATPase [Streptomyces]